MARFPASTVVARAPGLAPLQEGGRLLVVAPEAGSSILLEGERLRVFQDLARPMPAGELRRRHPGLAPEDLDDLLEALRLGGMLCVSGRPPESRVRDPEPPAFAGILTLRLTEGCSPACPDCAWTGGTPERRRAGGAGRPLRASSALGRMEPGVAREAVARALEDLPSGPLLLDLAGGEPLLALEALGAAVETARGARGEVSVAVRTGGVPLEAEAAALLAGLGVEVVLCLHEAPGCGPPSPLREAAEAAVRNLPAALEAGLAVAPAGIVRRPGQAAEFYEFLTGLGYRSFRLEPAAEDVGPGFLEVADRILAHWRSTPAPVRVHPLARMAAQALQGAGRPLCAHPECGSGAAWLSVDWRGRREALESHHGPAGRVSEGDPVRCGSCAFRGTCRGGCRHRREGSAPEPLCRFYREVYGGLLWRLHDHPDLPAALGLQARQSPVPTGESP